MIICYALAEGCGDLMSSWSRCIIFYTSCTFCGTPILSTCAFHSMSVSMHPVGAANHRFESKTSRGTLLRTHRCSSLWVVVVVQTCNIDVNPIWTFPQLGIPPGLSEPVAASRGKVTACAASIVWFWFWVQGILQASTTTKASLTMPSSTTSKLSCSTPPSSRLTTTSYELTTSSYNMCAVCATDPSLLHGLARDGAYRNCHAHWLVPCDVG